MKNVKVFATLILAVISIGCTSDDDTPVIETTITVKDFETTIDENPTTGQELGTIDVTTNQGTLTYAFKSEEPANAFDIDTKTGKLTIKNATLFDYETKVILTATVLIKNGDLTKEAKVTIHLNDIEDSNITVKDFETTIDENPTTGQELGTIEATTDQGELTYSLKNETPEGAFAIDTKTGKLTVKDATLFDYETRTSLTATVVVNNKEISKEAKTTITLNNVIENIVFADANFKKALLEHTKPIIDANGDQEIDTGEALIVKRLHLNNKNISDLSGIEYFTALTYLTCNENQLTSLGISKNINLDFLGCRDNQIASLDLSKNTALTGLQCDENMLTALDLSKNINLNWLTCAQNQLSALDVSHNTALTTIACGRNKLTALDVSNNIALTGLYCEYNLINTLDVSKQVNLSILDYSSTKITTLDTSNNIALTRLYCSSNNLTSLDISKNTALTLLQCNNNRLTSLDLSKNIKLDNLNCGWNRMTSLDLSKNTALTRLIFEVNPQLVSLYMKNGNNNILGTVRLQNNSNLTCIEVDDPTASYLANWQKDAAASYSSDCTP
ncbi:cadherin domain-containing protein [Aquimarina spinulae]|uniref:cadherin domain-containing protein n=3 Tax=Aquimarina spinulae TaxID=1192023 RepID=UPI000D55B51F|nr:cadherin domain-containing protein [Aquimarina spinulae]